MPRTVFRPFFFRNAGPTAVAPLLVLVLNLFGSALAQSQPETFAIPAPKVDVLDFYGLRHVTPQLVTQALGTREGGPLPVSKGEAEARINQLDRVVASALEAVQVEGIGTVLYIGIQEQDVPSYSLREPPGGADRLPASVINAYSDFLDARHAAEQRGEKVTEDLTRGYPISSDPEMRRFQGEFLQLARDNTDLLRKVLDQSGDDFHREAAAYLVAYVPRKSDVVNDLGYALRDGSADVRANAIHTLTAFSELALRNRESQLRIPARWFVDMLHSLSWTDRTDAMRILLVMTSQRFETLQQQLRDRALFPLGEMARWKVAEHARPAFILLARAAGISEKEIDQMLADSWTGDREQREDAVQSVLAKMPQKTP